jgi:hypothetical protein
MYGLFLDGEFRAHHMGCDRLCNRGIPALNVVSLNVCDAFRKDDNLTAFRVETCDS